ncbi:hypothetical protein A1O7_07305 [Cladophialophora yegresii CBS 114405]|uniref:Lysine-specific metallo-endopeptidase domain-containing protein n=1 Tax=Cladophialophora yegresii CBS 114405 TaxID=1182544 RepID=W9VXK8_9EURO|nr:uncharacterized protein A1O7_07305 [Cladophialophora yegresii CBS 114405]EXJ56961.1 hypothetical protein A1O7_07305 [Cladophialophora yegresii CBS 114405]
MVTLLHFFLLLLLSYPLPAHAARPFVWIEPIAPAPYIEWFHESWKEAIVLARAAALTFQGPCDPVYQRYFEDGGTSGPSSPPASLVRRIFQRIANIPLDAQYNAQDIQSLLSNQDILGLSPRFGRMTLALGTPPHTPDPWKNYCANRGISGAFLFGENRADATVVVCGAVLEYPLAAEILAVPPWARNVDGTPHAGYGCRGLGDRDTEFMIFPGAFILHELIHWSWLLQDLPQWQDFIAVLPAFGLRQIGDFAGTDPVSGYGAYNAKRLKERALGNPADFGSYPTLNNADSYMWYALSKYWAWTCGVDFGPARDEYDDFLRTQEGKVPAVQPLPGGGDASDRPDPGMVDFAHGSTGGG